jgi:hypothetical protein
MAQGLKDWPTIGSTVTLGHLGLEWWRMGILAANTLAREHQGHFNPH